MADEDKFDSWVNLALGAAPGDFAAPDAAPGGGGPPAEAPVQGPASGVAATTNPYAGRDGDEQSWRAGYDAGFSQPDEPAPAPIPYSDQARTIYDEGVLAGQDAIRGGPPQPSSTPAPPPSPPPPPAPPAPPPEEEHGWIWNVLHDHGLVNTRHERADNLRRAWGPPQVVWDDDGNPIDVSTLSDDEIVALNNKLLNEPRGKAMSLPVVPGQPDVNDMINTSKPGKQSKPGMGSNQFDRSGGFDQANKDFDRVAASGTIKDQGGGIRSATLSDGTTVSVRPNSSQGSATLQVNPPGGANPIKFRYP